jgi:hypothetical protein
MPVLIIGAGRLKKLSTVSQVSKRKGWSGLGARGVVLCKASSHRMPKTTTLVFSQWHLFSACFPGLLCPGKSRILPALALSGCLPLMTGVARAYNS